MSTSATVMTNSAVTADMQQRVKASQTSFAVGMLLLPKARREAMYALYAFCREVDDIADDDSRPEAWRLQALAEWRLRVGRLMQGRADMHPVAQVLLHVIQTYGLKENDLLAIIAGMEADAARPIYAPTWEELDVYCDCVASAVGRSSVRIFGDSSADAIEVAHHLGRALQLTNILRDVAEDAERGRLYLPREELEAQGLLILDLDAILNDARTGAVCAKVAARAQHHFTAAATYMKRCDHAAMRPARIMGAYYAAILRKLMAREWRNLRTRVTLSRLQKLWLAVTNL